MYYTIFDTPLCGIILAGDEKGISHLHLKTGESKRKFEISEEWVRNDAFFVETVRQLNEYFSGERRKFDLPVNPQGTDFQKSVWRQLSEIPYGELRTYKEIARSIGNENAARAVGMANGKNPVPLVIPCHRVIGSNGQLTGFAHGLAIKEKLIGLEQAVVAESGENQ